LSLSSCHGKAHAFAKPSARDDDQVGVNDAVVAVQLVEMSMQNAAMLGGLYSALHSQPSEQPEEDCTLSFRRAWAEAEIAKP
jgi:hypothetical protein